MGAKRRHKRPFASRKPKTYGLTEPGDIVQIDTLDIHPFPEVFPMPFPDKSPGIALKTPSCIGQSDPPE